MYTDKTYINNAMHQYAIKIINTLIIVVKNINRMCAVIYTITIKNPIVH